MQDELSRVLAGRYRIERELGRGGGGTVFLAHDLKHDRQVALKVLDPELARAIGPDRFLREIRITAGLSHPHILPLLDSGSSGDLTWFALAYAEGGTLRERLRERGVLPVGEAVRIASEVADALASAHRHSIVHRDVKPENVLFEEDHALLADFGIARALAGTDAATLTQVASVVGTPAYMSPEQIDGESAVTGAADQYALACMLFEMLAGSPPFPGASGAGVLSAHLAAAPPDLRALRPDVPARLAQVVARALSKNPGDRFADMSEFRAAITEPPVGGVETVALPRAKRHRLRAVLAVAGVLALFVTVRLFVSPRPAESPGVRSLAVLPLTNVSGDSGEEYFADGMTEELILELSKVSALRVISRTSVMSLKGQGLSLKEIGKRLGVDHVLEGTVARANGRVRINVQLFRVRPERQLWGERYDRPVEQSLALQSEIARAVVAPVRVQMTTAEAHRLEAPRDVPPEAHEAMLRGRFALARVDSTRYRDAIRQFSAAAQSAPGYADAWSGLARTYYFGSNIFIAPRFAMANARTAALRALAIDPDLAEAHATLGLVLSQYDWKFAEGERECREAVRLNPNDSESHYGLALILLETGRTAEAIQESELACQLDPLSNFRANFRAYCDYCNHDFDQSRSRYEAIATTDSNDVVALHSIALIDMAQDRPTDAIARLEPLASQSGLTLTQAILGSAYARAGRRADASQILATLQARSRGRYVAPTDLAVVQFALGDFDGTMACLARAYEARDENLLIMQCDPLYESLRRDRRFAGLFARIRGGGS